MIKPIPENPPFELEEYLAEIRQTFARFAHDGIELHPEDVCDLLTTLGHATDEARRMRDELSRKHWNDRAATDRIAEAVLAELKRPGTNVALFPVIARPFSDGGAA